MTIGEAVERVGVARRTCERWLARPEPEFVAFRGRVEDAHYSAEVDSAEEQAGSLSSDDLVTICEFGLGSGRPARVAPPAHALGWAVVYDLSTWQNDALIPLP